MKSLRALVLDNRDSFVFNLVDELRVTQVEVITVRSDIPLERWLQVLGASKPDLVLLSPGPGRPEDAGVMVPWLKTSPRVPILGICLGHQALAVAAGGRVRPAPKLVHGRAGKVDLHADPLFHGLPSPVDAGRYHSLVVTEVPEEMEVIATTGDDDGDLVMALRHRRLHQVGLQFHPESILTPEGSLIMRRFVEEVRRPAREMSGRRP
jgi:anthranilate synthase/aminodeoxychorismate synthase-like glutamine amidotransferase